MNSQFWIDAWNDGRTNFHLKETNKKLIQFFPELNAKEGDRVLVPLCGKTKDLLWLRDQKLEVHGVELHAPAVQAFFDENGIAFQTSQNGYFDEYTADHLRISCGDFFKLQEKDYDFIYDRAALVALPEDMRIDYARVITESLRSGGKCLLLVYEYDASELQGPPFSVLEKEIHALYEKHFHIRVLENVRPVNEGGRLSPLLTLRQIVYLLEKK